MLEPKRTFGLHSPSGVSPYVPVDKAHEPDVNAGGRLRGVLQPTLDSTVTETATPAAKGRGTKRNLTSYQNDSARVQATTLEPQRKNAQNERNTNTGYNLRIPSTGVPPVRAAMKSVKQFRATTHLTASITRENPFTKREVEEINESINVDDTKNKNSDDLQKDNYIPPNRRIMLKCKQRDK